MGDIQRFYNFIINNKDVQDWKILELPVGDDSIFEND